MSDFTTRTDISDPIYHQERVNIDAVTLIDEHSDTEFYIGVSKNGGDTTKPIWRIRRIKKTGNVWCICGYPNSDQDFIFIWDNRLTYTYP